MSDLISSYNNLCTFLKGVLYVDDARAMVISAYLFKGDSTIMQILVWKHEEVFGLLIEDKLLTM